MYAHQPAQCSKNKQEIVNSMVEYLYDYLKSKINVSICFSLLLNLIHFRDASFEEKSLILALEINCET